MKQIITQDSYIYYVDMDVMKDAFARIKEHQMVISDDYKEDDIRGTINTANNNQLVMTSIPYDEGWKIYVDGKKVEPVEISDALVGFYVEDAGDHEIRFLYRSNAFMIGLMITVISLSAFVLIIIFEKKLKSIKLIRTFFSVESNTSNTVKNTSNKK